MGALTLKSFPFILRDWDIRSYDAIDPTDSFGQDIKVYINKNQIIKIEPRFSNTNSNIWLTDKGRQFFDSISNYWSKNNENCMKTLRKKNKKGWEFLFKTITRTFYMFDVCNFNNFDFARLEVR